jgi:F-type H+-transporting ATPase subunit epsilon
MSFRTRIQTPGATVFDADTDGLVAPGTDGLFGVLAGHEASLCTIAVGVLAVRQGGRSLYFALGDGVAEIAPDTVTIFTEHAEPVERVEDAAEKLDAYLKLMATPVPAVVGAE